MKIPLDGDRPRLYAERKRVGEREGCPIHEGVTEDTRRRMMREVIAHSTYREANGQNAALTYWLLRDMKTVFGSPPGSGFHWQEDRLEDMAGPCQLDVFLEILELSAKHIVLRRPDPLSDLNVLQSLLADDLSAFRLVNVGPSDIPHIQVQKIDNEHLHREITDRTFELTRMTELASAQGDYADAWRHYRKGDLDDAVTNAGKAVESACKAAIKKIDPTSTPENLNLGPLVTLLVQKDIIPTAMTNVATHLEHIFRGSGGLRNQAGTGAHGSVDLTTPEASIALLALRMSGTLISFLAERLLQIKG